MSCKKDGSTLNWKDSMIVRVVLKMSSWVQATVYLTLAPSTSTSMSRGTSLEDFAYVI